MDLNEKVDIFTRELIEDGDTEMIDGVSFSTERFLAENYPEEDWNAESDAIILCTDDCQTIRVGFMDNAEESIRSAIEEA